MPEFTHWFGLELRRHAQDPGFYTAHEQRGPFGFYLSEINNSIGAWRACVRAVGPRDGDTSNLIAEGAAEHQDRQTARELAEGNYRRRVHNLTQVLQPNPTFVDMKYQPVKE